MGEVTKISWCDSTWNPLRGCSRVSEGCRNCYAEKMAARFCGAGQPYEGLATNSAGAHWTGKVELVEKHLLDPLHGQRTVKIESNREGNAMAKVAAVKQQWMRFGERMREWVTLPARWREYKQFLDMHSCWQEEHRALASQIGYVGCHHLEAGVKIARRFMGAEAALKRLADASELELASAGTTVPLKG